MKAVVMWLGLAAVFAGVLAIAPATAEAGCTTSSVCTRSYGRSTCRTVQTCSAPRVRRCSFTTRCTPQRTCVSRFGVSSCVTRQVCRRVQVC